jgi:hypothetical protein
MSAPSVVLSFVALAVPPSPASARQMTHTEAGAETCPPTPSEPRGRLTFWNLYGLAFGLVSPVPSGETSLGLGRMLRPRPSRIGNAWSTTLGYEFTLSVGGADFYSAFVSYGGRFGLVQHRHHLAAVGYGGRRGRLMYGMSGGVVLWNTRPLALEAQARLGYVFAVARGSTVRGVVGGQARLVGYLDAIPLPHFSVFIGLLVF